MGHEGDDPAAGDCRGLADRSDAAVLHRLCHAQAWLGHRRDRGFVERGIGTTLTGPFRLVVTDLPTIQEPTTWRTPAQWNRAQGR